MNNISTTTKVVRIILVAIAIGLIAWTVVANKSSDVSSDKIDAYVEARTDIKEKEIPSLVIFNTATSDDKSKDTGNIKNAVALRFNNESGKMHVVGVSFFELNGSTHKEYVKSMNEKSDINAKYYLCMNYKDIQHIMEYIGRTIPKNLNAREAEQMNLNQDNLYKMYGGKSQVQHLKEGLQRLNPLQMISYAEISFYGSENGNDIYYRNAMNSLMPSRGTLSLAEWEKVIDMIDDGKNNLTEEMWLQYCAAINNYKHGSAKWIK